MNRTIIYVGGTFDLFHLGHTNLLRKAKDIADVVVVALNGDKFVKDYKGNYPIMDEIERYGVINSCQYVDMCFIMETHERQKFYLELIKPTYILHGNDWEGDSLIKQLGISETFLKINKIKMKYVPYTDGISSTDIKERILKQNLL